MSAAPHTHRLKPKMGSKWEHVTDEQLASITKQVGERTLKASYTVEALAEKPAKLATVAEPVKKAGKGAIEAPPEADAHAPDNQ